MAVNKGVSRSRRADRPFVSKSKFLLGSQCRKLLWYAYNAKDQIPEPDAPQQAILDQGHEVGQLAKSLYPGGIEVSAGVTDLDQVLRHSLAAVKERQPLFEAGFVYNGGFARADILNPVRGNAWDIVEVKSSTEVKDVNLLDLAFQSFVYNGAGLRIRRCWLMHINKEYVRDGKIDPDRFFKLVDVTDEVAARSKEISSALEDMLATIQRKEQPDICIAPHCSDPYNPVHPGSRLTYICIALRPGSSTCNPGRRRGPVA